VRLGGAAAVACLGGALVAGAARGETISGPRLDYVLQCMGCHREDGSGAPGRVPSLDGVGRFLALPGGRAYLARVPGVAQAPLDDASLAALLNWLVARFDPAAAPFPPFDAAEVARLRAEPLLDATAERERILARSR
jgi:hypothetical protein